MDDLPDVVERTMEEGFQLHRQEKLAQDELRKQHEEDVKTINKLRHELWMAKEEKNGEMWEHRLAELEARDRMINLLELQHPHLATPIGLCLQPQSLVYEYLFDGSLEDRLLSTDGIRPLTWESRLRIAAEVCSAIVFLHSKGITHGNLQPSNILLDWNLNVKIINSGISHLLLDHYHTYVNNDPVGLHSYMDPEFFEEETLTKQVDVYSLGVIILRSLTGRSPLLLVEKVQKAVSAGRLKELIDPVAEDWLHVQVVQLANLALECCSARRDSRPDLKCHVWKLLEPMGHSQQPPSYFICPLSQEIMQDPQVAADGFTYEAEALQTWFDGGHDTSPMTNLRLRHLNLIPNLALRSAIRDWLDNS